MESHRRDAVLGGIRSKLLMTRNNLTTDGSEFLLPDGRPYSGPYHVHISNGAMVGERHTSRPHDRLTPVNRTIASKVAIIQRGLINERSNSEATPASPSPRLEVTRRTRTPRRRENNNQSSQRSGSSYGSGSGSGSVSGSGSGSGY